MIIPAEIIIERILDTFIYIISAIIKGIAAATIQMALCIHFSDESNWLRLMLLLAAKAANEPNIKVEKKNINPRTGAPKNNNLLCMYIIILLCQHFPLQWTAYTLLEWSHI